VFLLWKKARYILRHEGFPALLKKSLLFIRQSIYFSRKYNLHFAVLEQLLILEVKKPSIENLTVQIVSTNGAVEELSGKGFIFKPWKPEYKNRLDKGAIAFCAFDGTKLIHVSWCAMTEEAMKVLKEPPYRVDFAANEVANGDYWTDPEYRGRSVAFYVTQMRQKYLRENGIVSTRGATPFDNKTSQKVARLLPITARTVGHYRRILWWHTWKESPVDSKENPAA